MFTLDEYDEEDMDCANYAHSTLISPGIFVGTIHPGHQKYDENYLVGEIGNREYAAQFVHNRGDEMHCAPLSEKRRARGRCLPIRQVICYGEAGKASKVQPRPNLIRTLKHGWDLSCRGPNGSVMWLPIIGRDIPESGDIGWDYDEWEICWLTIEGDGPPPLN
jgi:hypothetical protein